MYLLLFTPSRIHAQIIAIKAGHVFDVESGEFLKDKLILIEGQKIIDIRNLSDKNEADEFIDLSDAWVMPGFIDLHVHLEGQSSPTAYLDRFRKNEADRAYDAAVYAKKTLIAGFTTVRDLGGSGVNTSLARAIQMGKVIGPTIYSAGKAIGTTGGHADPTNG